MRHAASSSSELLKVIERSGAAAVHRLTPVGGGQVYRDRRFFTQPSPPDVGSIRDLQAEGPDGPIALRMYHPLSHASNEPLPVLVYYHGGGFVIGDLDTDDVLCRRARQRLGLRSRCRGLSAGARTCVSRPPSSLWRRPSGYIVRGVGIAFDASRVAVVRRQRRRQFAAVVSIMARDEGGPPIRFQLLDDPGT